MKAKTKSLMFMGVFILCMALVALILVLTQPKNEEDDSSVQTQSTTIELLSYERDNISSMTVSNQYGEYTITQNAKGFSVNELGSLKQNSTVMGAAGNCATKITAQALVEKNAESLEKYGLEEGSETASCEVVMKDGTGYTLIFGSDAPDGSSVYMRMSDSTDVYTVLKSSASYFYNAKESYVSLIIKESISSESTAPTIDFLTITRKDLDYDIIFEDDTKNYATDEVSMASSQVMISPVYAYLDITNSNDILYGIWGLTATEAIKPFPTEEELAEYGLDDPFCTVRMDAELQVYTLLIGDVAGYSLDENGNETTEPAYFYGYYEGTDCIFVFSADEVKWATFQPIDILSSLMTSNYIYKLDYIDIQLHNGEDIDYYFDVTGNVDEGELSVMLDGSPASTEDFKILYQFLLKCPIDALCLEDPSPDAKLLAYIDFRREDGGGDTLEFYDDGTNRVTIKLNGYTSFSQPKSYLDTLCSNLELFKEGASGDQLQMIW